MADDRPRRLRKGGPPARAIVHYNGVPYVRDVAKCRSELTRLQAAREVSSTIGGLAIDVALSRSTVERFLNGYEVSMSSTVRILARLGLQFEDVHTLDRGGAGETG